MRLPVLLAIALVPCLAHATPLSIDHTGLLLGADDQPIDAPALDVTFRLVDAAEGTANVRWWVECPVAVRQGYYAVRLGEGACTGNGDALGTEAFAEGESRWLEIAIGTTTLAPRLRFGDGLSRDYLLRDTLANAGGSVNDPSNPVDWSRLKNVPGAIANGLAVQNGLGFDGTTLELATDAQSLSRVTGGAMEPCSNGGICLNATVLPVPVNSITRSGRRRSRLPVEADHRFRASRSPRSAATLGLA